MVKSTKTLGVKNKKVYYLLFLKHASDEEKNVLLFKSLSPKYWDYCLDGFRKTVLGRQTQSYREQAFHKWRKLAGDTEGMRKKIRKVLVAYGSILLASYVVIAVLMILSMI